jgi:hypothetical protein
MLSLINEACTEDIGILQESSLVVAPLANLVSLLHLYTMLAALAHKQDVLAVHLASVSTGRRYPAALVAFRAATADQAAVKLIVDNFVDVVQNITVASYSPNLPQRAQNACLAASLYCSLWVAQSSSTGKTVLPRRLCAMIPHLPTEPTIPTVSDTIGDVRGRIHGALGFKRRLGKLLDACMKVRGGVDVLLQRILGGVPQEHLHDAAAGLAHTLMQSSSAWDSPMASCAASQILALVRLRAPRASAASAASAAAVVQLQLGAAMTAHCIWLNGTARVRPASSSVGAAAGPLCVALSDALLAPWLAVGQQAAVHVFPLQAPATQAKDHGSNMDVILSCEVLHRVLGSCSAHPALLGSMASAVLGMLLSLPALKTAGSSAHSSACEVILQFFRGAPQQVVLHTVLTAMTQGAASGEPAGQLLPLPQHQFTAEAVLEEGTGLTMRVLRQVHSIERHTQSVTAVCDEVAPLLAQSGKGGGANQHLAAAVFNALLGQYAHVRMEISKLVATGRAVDVSGALQDAFHEVGDAGEGLFMSARSTTRNGGVAAARGVQATQQTVVLQRRRVALLVTALGSITEVAGSAVLRSAGTSLQAIGHLLRACAGTDTPLDEADEDLISVCLSLLTAMVVGGVALSAGGDVRQLKALLPTLAQLQGRLPVSHLSEMATALSMGILTYREAAVDSASGKAPGSELDALRAQLHTCSTMVLDSHAAFRGGGLMDAAHAITENLQAAKGSDVVSAAVRMALGQLQDEDSFVYTAAGQLLLTTARCDARVTALCLLSALQQSGANHALTLKLLEAWSTVLPALGVSLLGTATAFLRYALSSAARSVGRGQEEQLDVRAAFLSVSGQMCVELRGLGVGGAQLLWANLPAVCDVACGLLVRPPQLPSPAAAAKHAPRVHLLQNAAAFCLSQAVSSLSAASLGSDSELGIASHAATSLHAAAASVLGTDSTRIAQGHLQHAEATLRDLIRHSATPQASGKPSIAIGLRGSKILAR